MMNVSVVETWEEIESGKFMHEFLMLKDSNYDYLDICAWCVLKHRWTSNKEQEKSMILKNGAENFSSLLKLFWNLCNLSFNVNDAFSVHLTRTWLNYHWQLFSRLRHTDCNPKLFHRLTQNWDKHLSSPTSHSSIWKWNEVKRKML